MQTVSSDNTSFHLVRLQIILFSNIFPLSVKELLRTKVKQDEDVK